MEATPDFPSMGATLFFGLTFAALITQGPPPLEYANPKETMVDTRFEAPPDAVPFVSQVSWASFPTPVDPALPHEAAAPPADPVAEIAYVLQTATASQVAVMQTVLPLVDGSSPDDAGVTAGRDDPQLAVAFPDAMPFSSSVEQRPARAPAAGPVAAQVSLIDIATPAVPNTSVPQPVAANLPLPFTLPFLPAARPAARVPDGPKTRIVRVTGDRVFLRRDANGSAEPIDQFDTGTAALLREVRGKWRRITVGGETGWMFESYLQPNTLDH